MKDKEIRGKVLQKFYDHRKEGRLGINVNSMPRIEVDGVEDQEILRICDQLGQQGLIDWHGIEDSSGSGWAGGTGKINSFGVDVIDGDQEAPIPIQFDASTTIQNIHFAGTATGVQVAGAHSLQSQTISQEIEKLISAINGASVTETEKCEAKSALAKVLESKALSSILGAAVPALINLCSQ